MNIQRKYEKSINIRIKIISKLAYKINKVILNLFYDKITKKYRGIDESSDVIISLASFTPRIDKVAITIKTLLNQTYKPQKVILWLATREFPNKDEDLPNKLIKLKEKGLTIEYCDDLRSHKKYYFCMQKYPEKLIVTADDDILYPENMVEKLVEMHKKHPECVICNRASRFVLDNNEDVYSYDNWSDIYDTDLELASIIPIGMGGVLYPPKVLHCEVFNRENMEKTCITADDLWLKAMGIMNYRKAVLANAGKIPFFTLVGTQKNALYYQNVGENKSKKAWEDIMKVYPECRKILINMVKEEQNNGRFS